MSKRPGLAEHLAAAAFDGIELARPDAPYMTAAQMRDRCINIITIAIHEYAAARIGALSDDIYPTGSEP